MMMLLGCWGWVYEVFSEEELEIFKIGGLIFLGIV